MRQELQFLVSQMQNSQTNLPEGKLGSFPPCAFWKNPLNQGFRPAQSLGCQVGIWFPSGQIFYQRCVKEATGTTPEHLAYKPFLCSHFPFRGWSKAMEVCREKKGKHKERSAWWWTGRKSWFWVAMQSPSPLKRCEIPAFAFVRLIAALQKWAFWTICRQDTWWLTELLKNTNKPPFWRVFLWILCIYTQKSAGHGESLFRECNAPVLFFFSFFCCWAAHPAYIRRYLSYQTMESCLLFFIFFYINAQNQAVK